MPKFYACHPFKMRSICHDAWKNHDIITLKTEAPCFQGSGKVRDMAVRISAVSRRRFPYQTPRDTVNYRTPYHDLASSQMRIEVV